MRTKIIFQNEKTIVKEVWLRDKFFYTVTYIKDEDGYCEKMIRVYSDGTVEIQ